MTLLCEDNSIVRWDDTLADVFDAVYLEREQVQVNFMYLKVINITLPR